MRSLAAGRNPHHGAGRIGALVAARRDGAPSLAARNADAESLARARPVAPRPRSSSRRPPREIGEPRATVLVVRRRCCDRDDGVGDLMTRALTHSKAENASPLASLSPP